jgi:hypothetical protein
MRHDRKIHLTAVRRLVEELDVFVFTLGLTEMWERIDDGTAFPVCPGCGAGTFDRDTYRFRNLTVRETIEDLEESIALIMDHNPSAKILLSVSPVPLIASYSQNHVLSATTYSKSVLRVAAEEVRNNHAHVDYLPAYEIITGPQARGRYIAEDLRNVLEPGVARVMQCFFDTFSTSSDLPDTVDRSTTPFPSAPHTIDLVSLLCDEEHLTKSLER